MTLQAGARLGPYEVLSALGAGGMGEVYRARDTRLDRDVAIKILPAPFAADAERIARFQREARTLASLSHPNIAIIHGLEQAGDLYALVMELVPGEDLSQRIARGAIPLDEALPIAKQIAEALEAAHEQGIIHRDLKPANIKVRPDGTVKVLDFGLAKAMEPSTGSSPSVSMSPTITSPAQMTGAGVILGTAAYMSPEQAKGKPLDKRADIWAFGCVLYEMLTARRTFGGDEVTETLADIMRVEPEWSALPANAPQPIRRLLRRALSKDRRERLSDMADARLDITEAMAMRDTDVAPAVKVPDRRRERLAWGVAAVALVSVFALTIPAVRYLRQASIDALEMRLEVNTPPTDDPFSMAISPDGQRLVFSAASEGKTQLWVRPLDSMVAQPLAGTDGAYRPFWKPDSRSIGFFADGKLKRIDASGGSVQTLADAPAGRGGTWNADGVILFARRQGAILRVAETSGEPVQVTSLDDRRQYSHDSPQFLPDNRHFLYFADGTTDARGIYLAALDAPEGRRLLDADTAATFAPPGALLFGRQGTLRAQRFDPDRLLLVGDPFPVAEQVAFDPATRRVAVSAATTGAVIYRTGSGLGARQLIWVNRSGERIGVVGDPDLALPSSPELSPDGTRVALSRAVAGNGDIWLMDAARGVPRKFTVDAANESSPVWSPDGGRIVFISNPKGVLDLYQKAVGGGASELLFASEQNKRPQDWSKDGRFLLYYSIDPQTGANYDLWALPFAGDRQPFAVAKTQFNERDGQFSPDGHWIAYVSNETGQYEAYVQPFPGPGAQQRVSTTGGVQPRWRGDGKELFYLATDGKMMAAPIGPAPDGQTLQLGDPVALFPTHLALGTTPAGNKQQYDVAADGQRFLLNVEISEVTAAPITIVLNWRAGPKK